MRSTRKAHKKTYYSSGAQCAGEAHNTAPGPAASKSIAGFSKLKAAPKAGGTSGPGTSNPHIGAGASGYGMVGPGAPKPRGLKGGASHPGSGPTKSTQGTSSPKSKKGPSGLGEYGTNYAPRGGP